MSITRLMRTANQSALAATLLLLVSTCPGIAFADLDTTAHFSIAPQPLQNAVIQYTEQSGVQITSAAELLKGRKSAAVIGSFSASAALTKLLAGTDLAYDVVDPNTVAIRAKKDSHSALSKASIDSASSASSTSTQHLAQVDQGTSGDASVKKLDDQESKKKKADQLEEIVVTGSRIPTAATQGAQEVMVYTREKIDASGQTTVSDFLNTLPSVSVAVGENGFQTSGGATTVQLRGLPTGTTLILINGRRIQNSGSQSGFFFDLNNIPLSAVDRIEVVADGSSAIYGSDAIAGVVNIVLKQGFDGFEASTKYGEADEFHEADTSLSVGKHWDKGSLTIVGSFQNRGGLDASKRTLTASNDYTAYGGPNNNLPVCNPGNVLSVDGVTPLPGLGSATFAAVPSGFTGKPSTQEFTGTAGKLNECAFSAGASIIPPTRRAGVFAQGSYELTPAIELFTELMYSDVKELTDIGPQRLIGAPGFIVFTVPTTNPYNPFGTTVGIAESIPSIRQSGFMNTIFARYLVGAKGRFLDNWNWEVSAWKSRDSGTFPTQNVNADVVAIQDALNSSNPATALNPFVAGPAGPQSQLQSFFSSALTTTHGGEQSVNAFMRGPIFRLPSGAVELVIGGEYDRDTVSDDIVVPETGGVTGGTSSSRRSYAAFTEARIPIVGPHGTSQKLDTLAVTLAYRYDKFSDFGTKDTPQIGAEWRPIDTLLLRAAYAQAFKAPPLFFLYFPVASQVTPVVDPVTGQVVTVTDVFGGNTHLLPETGWSHTFGVVYSSEAVPGLQLSLTDWEIVENNAITALPLTTIVDNANLFPGRVVRNASGALTQVNDTFINFGLINVAGLDYQVSYRIENRFGEFTPAISVAETYHDLTELLPGAPLVDADSKAQDSGNWAPRWKGTAALGWKRGPYSVNIDGRYVSRYQDYDSTAEIGKFWLLDANVHYAFGDSLLHDNQWLKGSYIEVGGINVANARPQFSNYSFGITGYDVAQADMRGRFIYLQFGIKL